MSSKKKVCIIYNFAQHYRTSIFCLLDKEFDCSYYFGDSYLDIKKMDYSKLKGDVHEVSTIKFGPFIYRCGIISLLNKKFDAYIVLGESRVFSTWLFLILARIFRKNNVFSWTHGWYGKEKGIIKFLNKIFLKLPTGGNFFYGNYGRLLAIKEGISAVRQFTVHNSLAYEQQLKIRSQLKRTSVFQDHFNNNNKNIIFIGRLTKIKRLDLLLEALKACHDRGFDYNLTLIGGGENTDDLLKLSSILEMNNQVWFYGSCYNESLIGELIYNSDLCVSPGNVGLTAMHALVFGCPVITHNRFSLQMPEFEAVITGKTGDFFEYNDSRSLTDTIINWLQNNSDNREGVRINCMKEIDDNWTPEFQLNIFKKAINDSIH